MDQSLQMVLQSIIKVIGFDQWKKHLKDLNINRNIGILKEKYVVGPDFILNLDILEARHQLDNIVCYSGLKDTTFDDLQRGLSIRPSLQNRPPLAQLNLLVASQNLPRNPPALIQSDEVLRLSNSVPIEGQQRVSSSANNSSNPSRARVNPLLAQQNAPSV